MVRTAHGKLPRAAKNGGMLRTFSAGLMVLFVLAALPAAAASKSDPALDAPPAGLTATGTTLKQILALHDRAVGRKSGMRDTVRETWSFTDTGLQGTEQLDRSGTDYHSVIRTAANTEEFGQSGDKRWHRGPNGFVTTTSGRDERSFFALRVDEDAADPKNDVSVAGESADPAAYVVKIKVTGARHPEWAFYDKATGNLVRFEYASGRGRVATTFDDFKTVDGVTQAWHVHDKWWDPALDDDYRLTSFHAGMAITRSAFTQPSPVTPQGANVREKLPVEFVDGMAMIRVYIGDRGLDFELDSSQPNSMIEHDLADELHLDAYGHAKTTSKGEQTEYWTRIPDLQIGTQHLKNFAVRTADVAYKPSDHTKIVGVLGYDFLANFVVHVDYVNKIVELIPNKYFDSSKPVAGGLELPFALDDGVPMVPMQIGSSLAKNVVLNCDIPFTLVFGTFTDAHTADFENLFGNAKEGTVPFADNGSFGTTARIWPARVGALMFANLNYSSLIVIATDYPYDEPSDADAMIGLDYLSLFDLYFDYPHNRFIVVPNKWFYEISTKGKS